MFSIELLTSNDLVLQASVLHLKRNFNMTIFDVQYFHSVQADVS